MRNIMIKLQYDGTVYAGWQRQKNATTVQEVLECALAKIVGQPTGVTGCSRTDSGVHARTYICNFKTDSKLAPAKFIDALNALTPKDMIVYQCEEVSQNFHSRYQTISKTYLYQIDHSLYGDVFQQRYSWHYPYFLDIPKMQQAAKAFVGVHDFGSFMAAGSQIQNTVREIYTCEIVQDGPMIRLWVKGNGFLYHMVRIMAGTIVYIGNGRLQENVTEIIEAKDRNRSGITAPPQGLFLFDVQYEDKKNLG